jgi:hypothetical protein
MGFQDVSWFDQNGEELALQEYVGRMESWQRGISDGRISTEELREQAERVETLFRTLEGQLDPELHRLVTETLLEYAVLQGMHGALLLEEQRNIQTGKTTATGGR